MSKLRVLDLFAGIGGFSLGLEWTGGFSTVAFCEIEPFCQKVLKKHWPEVPIYDDVRTLTIDVLDRDGITVDVITGGFPCQDVFVAGRREGLEGRRSGLWSEIVRLVRDVRPKYVIVENVANLISGPDDRPGRWFGRVLGDLAEIGYDAEWHCIPASAIGAPHGRDRVWLMAYPEQVERVCPVFDANHATQEAWKNATIGDEDGIRPEMGGALRSVSGRWMDQPDPVRMANGVSDWPHRLGACGNAVVPQIPEIIGKAILREVSP